MIVAVLKMFLSRLSISIGLFIFVATVTLIIYEGTRSREER